MKTPFRVLPPRRVFLVALPLAFVVSLLLSTAVSAHAILLRSDPAKDAVLHVAPQQVRMWFSEDVNPALSTAVVVNGVNQRVDQHDAHVSPNDPREMDMGLAGDLPPAVYVVVWRTDSADDGHVLIGSFLFTVARPDGTVPTLSGGTVPGQGVLGTSALSSQSGGLFDGLTLFNAVMITLVEVAAVFWVGAQFWHVFVLHPATEDHAELGALHQQVYARFERFFSLPTLLVLLFANGGVLLGQAVTLTGGNIVAAFAPSLLRSLVGGGHFGAYWLLRMIAITLALSLSLSQIRRSTLTRGLSSLLSWANLLLGLTLFIAITMSSHAAAVMPGLVVSAVVSDWLHLVAALWVGGMMYLATSYLPILRRPPPAERAHALITILRYYSPWALAGVVIMTITGPVSATVHLASWEQLLLTAYGRVLDVKILLVGALLLTSALHVLVLRPRLAKEEQKYIQAVARLSTPRAEDAPSWSVQGPARQVKLREQRLIGQTRRLTRILRYEPLLGVAVFQFSSPSSAPYGLALDAQENIWFTAAGSSTIGKIAADTTLHS